MMQTTRNWLCLSPCSPSQKCLFALLVSVPLPILNANLFMRNSNYYQRNVSLYPNATHTQEFSIRFIHFCSLFALMCCRCYICEIIQRASAVLLAVSEFGAKNKQYKWQSLALFRVFFLLSNKNMVEPLTTATTRKKTQTSKCPM